MFQRIILATWVLFWVLVLVAALLLLLFHPKPGLWVPFAGAIRPALFVMVIVSLGGALTWMYREGIKRARR